MIKAVAFFATLAGSALAFDAPFGVAGHLSGVASVVDGDGIAIGGVEVRLQGIAAPEDGGHRVDPGGRAASEALRSLAEGKRVVCYFDGSKTRGRPVGVCVVDGRDVGQIMVRNGFARDCPRYSGGRYAEAERQARADGLNLSEIYPLPRYC